MKSAKRGWVTGGFKLRGGSGADGPRSVVRTQKAEDRSQKTENWKPENAHHAVAEGRGGPRGFQTRS